MRYSSIADKMMNRGGAFDEYVNPRAASEARRKLIPEGLHMWETESLDLAAPEPEIDGAIMTKVYFSAHLFHLYLKLIKIIC